MVMSMASILTHGIFHVPHGKYHAILRGMRWESPICDVPWDVDANGTVIIPWHVPWDCGCVIGVDIPRHVSYDPIGSHGTSLAAHGASHGTSHGHVPIP